MINSPLLKPFAIAVAALGGASGTWAFADHFGFRPALIEEVKAVQADVTVVASSVNWLRLENFERRLARGHKLTRKECAEYRDLAKRLNVIPKNCG
jgi:hypothetical protein